MKHYDRCGHCNLFMTQQCPREPGDRKLKNWNSIESFKCEKFDRPEYSITLEEQDKIDEKNEILAEEKRRKEEAELLTDLFKSFF